MLRGASLAAKMAADAVRPTENTPSLGPAPAVDPLGAPVATTGPRGGGGAGGRWQARKRPNSHHTAGGPLGGLSRGMRYMTSKWSLPTVPAEVRTAEEARLFIELLRSPRVWRAGSKR